MNIKNANRASFKMQYKKLLLNLSSHKSIIRLKILYLAFYFNNNFECSSHPYIYQLVLDYENILRISLFSIDA